MFDVYRDRPPKCKSGYQLFFHSPLFKQFTEVQKSLFCFLAPLSLNDSTRRTIKISTAVYYACWKFIVCWACARHFFEKPDPRGLFCISTLPSFNNITSCPEIVFSYIILSVWDSHALWSLVCFVMSSTFYLTSKSVQPAWLHTTPI